MKRQKSGRQEDENRKQRKGKWNRILAMRKAQERKGEV